MDQDDREQFRSFLLQSRVDSALAEFTLDGEVVMVALVDRLMDGLSAVYTFYEPELAKRSLGTFGVLSPVAPGPGDGAALPLPGLLDRQSGKMAYKRGFQPIEALASGQWKRLEDSEPGSSATPTQKDE